MKRILLLANAFPYGSWEPYLVNEIPYLCQSAEVSIFSLMLRKEQLAEKREISPQVQRVHKIFFAPAIIYLLWAFRALFDPNLYREIRLLSRTGRLSFSRIKILFIFLSRVHYEKNKILRVLRQDPIYSPNDEVVIYAYRFAYQPYLASLIKKYFTGRVKIVARAHGSDLYQSQAPGGYIPLRIATMKSIDEVHLVSEFGYHYLVQAFPDFSHKYHLSHLGVGRNQKRIVGKDLNQLRLVTCSTITSVKRLDLLVEALTLITDISVQWDHFGTGPLAKELEVATKNLPPNVQVVFHGQVENSQINKFFAQGKTDFLINVSESEGIPVSIMEALATGTPVVATRVGGNSEIVKDQINGFLLDSDPTSQVLANRLKKLYQMDKEEYDRLANGAYFSWEKNWDKEQNYLSFSKTLFS